jgi:sulfonate transport system permease protein
MTAVTYELVDLPTRGARGKPGQAGRPRRLTRWVPSGTERLAGVAALLVLWQLAYNTGLTTSDTLAGPVQVGQAGWHMLANGTLESAIWVSLQRVLIGLAIGVPAGVILALIAGLSRIGDDIVDTPLQALRFVPVIGLEPLIVLWFGIGEVAKVSLIVFAVMFPIYINTYHAVRAIDPRYHELSKVVGLSRLKVIQKVVMPGALPGFLVGLRMATGVAWLILVFAEQINATNGIGYLITQAETFYLSNEIIVGLATYAVLGLISDLLVRALERKVLAWQPSR